MINITLPDGSKRELPEGSSPLDLALDISKSLAKAAMIARVNGEEWDLKRPFDGDSEVAIITRKDEEALEVIRHDTAHILAQAVQELFPGTQVTIGPAIEDGFYYDFAREEPFSPEDFEAIEKRMAQIVDADLPFEREVWDRNEAIAKFEDLGERYKAELIRDLPEDEVVTLYRQGEWFDLCRGPHLPSTGKIGKAFKLMKVAGAYWRGDHRNAMLQRIYGTAWRDDKELKAHLHRLEEAEKRDHRRLGKQMELFHFQEEAQGQVFWHPNGWTLYRTVEDYMRRRLQADGYVEIKTPQLMDRKFWEASGHWDKYRENMFISSIDQEEKVLAVKPMNCPCHVQVFNQGQKSYRDLPLRMAEFGSCHRYEPSGSLHGLMRVRGFVQDDAHIFCTVEQITDEVKRFCELLKSVYKDFGFEDIRIKFSDRPDMRVGSDEVWDKAEAALREAAEASGLDYEHNPGDGAFYGPKLDFVLKDAIGREWQTGTIQCDFNLPERLDASFVGEDSDKHRPVMLHRAVLGSLERFLGVLIESYAGKLPMWLAPRQVVVATITSDADDYALDVCEKMKAAGLRVETDLRNEKINYKVREHSVGKVPVIAVVGRKEAEDGTLALRFLGEQGRNQEMMSLDEAIVKLQDAATAPDLKRV
ncbi:threonine--tRNA ligase [Maricaulis sp. D1M11]|uniref:threonine--tRNA ligase n=1 Tax=Maricaulis sp. D1M11 TaxID=3076117 RepID=UPI0039B64DED